MADSPAARALQRAGANLIVGDLDDPASLRTSMEGAHGVETLSAESEQI